MGVSAASPRGPRKVATLLGLIAADEDAVPAAFVNKCTVTPVVVLSSSSLPKGMTSRSCDKAEKGEVHLKDGVNEGNDEPCGDETPTWRRRLEMSAAALSCCLYATCSISMVSKCHLVASKMCAQVVTNKCLASQFPVEARILLLAMQNGVATALVTCCRALGVVEYEALDLATARAWLPVNVIFVAMLASGFFAMRSLSVPMLTVFKQFSNFLTLLGEWHFFGQKATPAIAGSIVVMIVGAVAAADLDLEFSAIGYAWQLLNCALTSAYVLYLRHVVHNVKIPKFGMVFYNNLLSLPLLFFMAACNHEFPALYDAFQDGILKENIRGFLALNLLAGTIGFLLNFASLWCVSATSATTYAVVGALNKIPLALAGVFLFHSPITKPASVCIATSLFGGLLYTAAKLSRRA